MLNMFANQYNRRTQTHHHHHSTRLPPTASKELSVGVFNKQHET